MSKDIPRPHEGRLFTEGEEGAQIETYVDTEGKEVHGHPVQNEGDIEYKYWLDLTLSDGKTVKAIRAYNTKPATGALDRFQLIYETDDVVVYSDVSLGSTAVAKREMEEKLAGILD